MTRRHLVIAIVSAALLGVVAVPAQAQRRAGRLGPPAAGEGVTAAQAEQLFDQFVMRQARIALDLAPSQVAPFGRRLQQLQAARRRGQRQRQQLLNELNQISRGAEPADEATLNGKLKALDGLTAAVEQRVREAYARIDEILDVRQRARFRILEQRMERQKLDLIARARGAARRQAPDPPDPDSAR